MVGTINTTPSPRLLAEVMEHELNAYGQGFGGCIRRCRFRVSAGTGPLGAYTVLVEHNGRDVFWLDVVMTVEKPSRYDDRMAAVQPWLRGLHRFPVESGIK